MKPGIRLKNTVKEQSVSSRMPKKDLAKLMLAGLYTVTKSVTNNADVWGIRGNCHQLCHQPEGNGGQ
jgi:hypothetical protein